MQTVLANRVGQLVDRGWEPMTEASVSLVGLHPFSFWLFLFLALFFPLFGGILYLIFWLATSRATVFLHAEGEELVESGDLWLVHMQEMEEEAYVERQREVERRGFMAVMWPQLLVFLLFLGLWVWLLGWYL